MLDLLNTVLGLWFDQAGFLSSNIIQQRVSRKDLDRGDLLKKNSLLALSLSCVTLAVHIYIIIGFCRLPVLQKKYSGDKGMPCQVFCRRWSIAFA